MNWRLTCKRDHVHNNKNRSRGIMFFLKNKEAGMGWRDSSVGRGTFHGNLKMSL